MCTYTAAFSGGVARGGSGNFSSNACVITSESGVHFSSSFIRGTLPSGLMFKNLLNTEKMSTYSYKTVQMIKMSTEIETNQ